MKLILRMENNKLIIEVQHDGEVVVQTSASGGVAEERAGRPASAGGAGPAPEKKRGVGEDEEIDISRYEEMIMEPDAGAGGERREAVEARGEEERKEDDGRVPIEELLSLAPEG